ncbi:hypothetical protein [Escherichia coli]|uniref:hypothetical protein n=1 Tax=Escherichia coli TaxID=562 RepID=UPI000DF7276D|nr:hypothetical protein [Escherichia coli]RCX84790.1 hypothetical protein DTL30_25810 [Escherichia coli]
MHEKAQTKIKDTIREILITPAIAFTGRAGHFDFSLYEVLANELNKRKIKLCKNFPTDSEIWTLLFIQGYLTLTQSILIVSA